MSEPTPPLGPRPVAEPGAHPRGGSGPPRGGRLPGWLQPGGGSPRARQNRKLVWLALGVAAALWVGLGETFAAMPPQARAMGAVAALMAIWWITEAIPIAATALVPLVALPLLGIASPREAAAPYADPNVFLFIGGFVLASCMERWNLHRRIALTILTGLGASPHRVLIGCMGVTAFLSMWASNTATTLMMVPIGMALVGGEREEGSERATYATCLFLAIAYSASVGGMGTLIGTPPNIVFASLVRRLEVGAGEVSFLRWMGIGLPVMAVMLPLIYLLLTRVLFRFGPSALGTDAATLREERARLGPISMGERQIAVIFSATALLWIFRRDIVLGAVTLPGWTRLLPFGDLIHDSTVAIAMAALTFMVPVDRARGVFLMDHDWYRRIPWHIVILFGGGFSLAEGFQTSGLSAYLGEQLGFLAGLPTLGTILAICLFMTFLTELTSNTATTTALLPILAATATASGQHALLYMLPATLAASCAFMLPVATPPNAIVFGSGAVRLPQMARAGVLINLISAPVIAALVYWLGPMLFDFAR